MPLFYNSNNEVEEQNRQMIADIEEKLNAMSEEERNAILAVDDAMDRLAVIELAKKGINVELIPGDRHHIMVEGRRMGYADFGEYLEEKLGIDYDEEEYDEDYDDNDDYDE